MRRKKENMFNRIFFKLIAADQVPNAAKIFEGLKP